MTLSGFPIEEPLDWIEDDDWWDSLRLDEEPEKKAIRQWFIAKGIPAPDAIFPAVVLDCGYRKATNETVPIGCGINERVSGCYAWMDLETSSPEIEIWYVGKGLDVRNRCQQWWANSCWAVKPDFLDRWMQFVDATNGVFMPMVAVWEREDRASFEQMLIDKLNPKCNIHRNQ